jgi:hypothetical protein
MCSLARGSDDAGFCPVNRLRSTTVHADGRVSCSALGGPPSAPEPSRDHTSTGLAARNAWMHRD